MIEVTLLGEMGFRLDDQPLTQFKTKKEAALLVYLAHTGGAHSREAVADLLWESTSTKQSLSNLRTVLARLRKSIGDELIVTRTTVALDSKTHENTDSVRFQAQLHAQRPAEAMALYGGGLMNGFYVPKAPRFNDWLAVERERLRLLAIGGLRTMLQKQESAGAFADGAATARRLIAFDELDEAAHRGLIRLLALGGEQAAALQAFEALGELLQAELGLEPEPETVALVNGIRDGSIAPVRVAAGNLPRRLRPLFGRNTPQQTLKSLLLNPDYPLVALTGAGGIGKTSLALSVGRELLEENHPVFADGIWLLALETIEEGTPSEIGTQVATIAGEAMGLTFHSQGDLWSQLLAQLADKNVLLILDNVEQFVAVASDLMVALLAAGSGVQLLVTSRRVPALSETVALPLDGLAVPADASADALQNDCVKLFAERAARTPTPFSIEKSLPDVVEICRFVEGVPLAIELAAASLGRLMIGEVLPALRENLALINSELPDLPARQRTLQAVFDFSWQTLDARERETLAAISVFRGGFVRNSAESILENGTGALFNLQHHALLGRDETGRFRLHPLIRQLAHGRLTADRAQAVSTRHAVYFATLAQSFTADLRQNEARIALDTLLPEQANLRAGRLYAVEAQLWQTIGDGLEGMHYFYRRKGLFGEEAALLDAAIARLGNANALLLSRLLTARAWCYSQSAEYETGVEIAEQAIQLAQNADNLTAEAEARLVLVQLLTLLVRFEPGLDHSQKVIELAQAADDPLLEADGCAGYGSQMLYQHDPTPAEKPLRRALELYRRHNHKVGEMKTLLLLAGYTQAQHDLEQCLDCIEQALALSRELGDVAVEAEALGSAGVIVGQMGDPGAAEPYLEQALAVYRRLNMPEREIWMLSSLGGNVRDYGQYDSAEKHFTDALILSEQAGDLFWQARSGLQRGMVWIETGESAKAVPALREAFERAVACGHPRLPVMALFPLGLALLAQNDFEAAEREFRQAHDRWIEAGMPVGTSESLVGLAVALLGQNRPKEAATYADTLWQLWQDEPETPERTQLKIHWLLFTVFRELGDDRQQTVLETAQALLHDQAAKIKDDAIRRMFLENVPDHRLILGASSTVG